MVQRTLLIDDNTLFRQGLQALLQTRAEFDVVADVSDRQAAFSAAAEHRPDLVISEIELNGHSALDMLSGLKRLLGSLRIVVLSHQCGQQFVQDALRLGVDGYVAKDASVDDVIGAACNAVAGKRFVSPDIAVRLVESFVEPRRGGAAGSPLDRLTNRELSILRLIAEGQSNRAAAAELQVSTKTVEKHRANVMRKLGLRSPGELLMLAVEIGMIERPQSLTTLLHR